MNPPSCKTYSMDLQTDLKIPWDFSFDEERLSFEEFLQYSTAIAGFTDAPATFEWFKARGYTLFERDTEFSNEQDPFPQSFLPRMPAERSAGANYPFPHHMRWFEEKDPLFARLVS